MYRIIRLCVIGIVLLFSVEIQTAFAQSILTRNISIHVKNMPLGVVLKTMEEKGKFYFSYNSNILKTDSLISVDADNLTIRDVLNQMLRSRFEYKETKDYVILRYAPLKLSLITEKAITENNEYVITGFITDEQNGRKLPNASVYEKNLLQSTLTNADGYFELRLKNEGVQVHLTISKEFYKDTTIIFLNDVKINRQVNRSAFYYAVNNDFEGIETTSLGKLFISTRQRIQSMNLSGMIANAPFQASAIPNVSTHGELSGQIVNKVSLNAVGGYNAGVDGAELGIIFNLDKGNVQHFQLAGAFNIVGGTVNGVQIGGLYNNVLGNFNGVQFALLHNSIKHDLNGVQFSLYNHVRGSLSGMQIGPVGNIANGNVNGIQLAALGNVAGAKFSGIQIGGVFNYARNLRGLQIGLVNIADTSSGFSIGLINIVRHGYHKLTLSANETLNANIAVKSGSENLYTIYTAGARLNNNSKIYGFGLGFGNLMHLSKSFAFNPELSSRYLYEGSWDYANFLNRLDANINIKLSRWISITGGPALNVFYSNQQTSVNGYALAQNLHHNLPSDNRKLNWWIGWNLGINFF
ncbi:STN and carboxypeptidase regulatory-like domain-containing protein [Mucilaginibacter segetis]|uniref:Carboxypeptidase-like regulatory domain-containing protein n=1 Tax=Mucilaginibacter segetis TaxID=2793071 RepID=A0A934UKU9_9SPHI|nr:STN and carboxypeptidase regulatory-like domain-containing protein [Mucilaginibacter segetis]MBK0377843.1 carboxypeptidase-like regulatory domain-containing protein [Mucilaginibacter segetis]